ncbi:hypothetical protein HDV64DRAFT_62565 [Trichoderma sp. TUCIM 5745]
MALRAIKPASSPFFAISLPTKQLAPLRGGSWHWPSSSRAQRDVSPWWNQDKSFASPSPSISLNHPNHCFPYASKAFEFRCRRPSLHYGDNLHLLLAETTVWRNQPSPDTRLHAASRILAKL